MSADDEPGELGRHEAILLALETFGGNAIALRILLACSVEPTAPRDIDHGQSLGVAAYHFREMHKAKLIKVVRKERRRGAIKTYYTATARARKVLAQLGLPEESEDASS